MTEPVHVLTIDTIPAYEGPHAIPGIRFRAARAAFGVTAWGMNVLDFDPHNAGHPEHDHAADGQEEVYVVLEGTIYLEAMGSQRVIRAGEMVRVAPEVKRKLVTGEEGARVLAIGATPGKAFEPTM